MQEIYRGRCIKGEVAGEQGHKKSSMVQKCPGSSTLTVCHSPAPYGESGLRGMLWILKLGSGDN